MAWEYAMYKGDEFLCIGTKEEICKQMNITPKTFGFYRTNHYKNRPTRNGNRRMIYRIDGKDKLFSDLQQY